MTATCSKKVTPPEAFGGTGTEGHWFCSSGRPQLQQVQQPSDNSSGNSSPTIVVDVVKCADAERCADGFDCEIPSGQSSGICCQRAQESIGMTTVNIELEKI